MKNQLTGFSLFMTVLLYYNGRRFRLEAVFAGDEPLRRYRDRYADSL
jgi:hypothetical protein